MIAQTQIRFAILKAAVSLNNMVQEMMKKKLELKRITKTASILLSAGFSSPAAFTTLEQRCLNKQNIDGGWVAVVDTMWNAYFLSLMNSDNRCIDNAFKYLQDNQCENQIWGRSKRDFERIPVSGVMLYLFPTLATKSRLEALEKLWISECGSLTYKASYTLMAFKKNEYLPHEKKLIEDTVKWLIDNQREDGSFAPWKLHPVASDTYCTAIALLGMLAYKELVPVEHITKAVKWLLATQLPVGIWPFHEIEDGTGWALHALVEAKKTGLCHE